MDVVRIQTINRDWNITKENRPKEEAFFQEKIVAALSGNLSVEEMKTLIGNLNNQVMKYYTELEIAHSVIGELSGALEKVTGEDIMTMVVPPRQENEITSLNDKFM